VIIKLGKRTGEMFPHVIKPKEINGVPTRGESLKTARKETSRGTANRGGKMVNLS